MYARARAARASHTTAHAGEAAGRRKHLGRGARARGGPHRPRHARRRGSGARGLSEASISSPIEMCPISNVRTGVVSKASAAHPIRPLLRRRVARVGQHRRSRRCSTTVARSRIPRARGRARRLHPRRGRKNLIDNAIRLHLGPRVDAHQGSAEAMSSPTADHWQPRTDTIQQ